MVMTSGRDHDRHLCKGEASPWTTKAVPASPGNIQERCLPKAFNSMPVQGENPHTDASPLTTVMSQEDGQSVPREERPPLPPRPSELALLSSHPPTSQGLNTKTGGSLLS